MNATIQLPATTASATHHSQIRRASPVGWALLGLLALTALLRLPAIDRPLVGAFATKNAVYAMIARNAVLGRAPWWRPSVDCLAGGQRGWHLVEFPVSAILSGGVWRVLGGSLEVWGRLTALVFSVASVGLLWMLVRRWHGPAAGWGAAVALALAPVSVIYGQSFMLESSVVFFTLATLASVDRWLSGRRTAWLIVGAACLALLLLTKIYMLVILLPLVGLVWRGRGADQGRLTPRDWLAPLFAAGFALLPAAVWYADAYRVSADPQTSERIYFSIKRSAADHAMPHPILRQPDFYRGLIDDLSGVALTPLGLTLAVLGVARPAWRRHLPWLLAMAVLIAVLPLKFHEMNYYWLVVLPPLCILVGLGWSTIVERVRPSGAWMAVVVLLAVVFSLRYAAKGAFGTPAEDRSVVEAAEAARRLTTADESIVTMHGSTIDLLYYCDRTGWAVPADRPGLKEMLADCRRQGARFLVVAGLDQVDAAGPNRTFLASLPIERAGDDFRILRLPAE
jgi:hypothetical protein